MKFTPKEDFKFKSMTFEVGNSYDSEKHGVSEEKLKAWHANGWCEVEGFDKAPERQVRKAIVRPDNVTHVVTKKGDK